MDVKGSCWEELVDGAGGDSCASKLCPCSVAADNNETYRRLAAEGSVYGQLLPAAPACTPKIEIQAWAAIVRTATDTET